MKEIKIAFKEDMVLLSTHEILPFQGDLKSLSKDGYKKLKNEIIETGFAFPIHVWQHKKKFYSVDGHQRVRVVEQMKIEGYQFPHKLPCVVVEAKDMKEAKRRVLQGVSQYGKVQEDGLYEFMHDADFSIDEVKDQFDIPDVDLPHFESNFFDEPSKPVEGEDDVPEVKETDIKLGDLFQLGEHRLLCGDATNKEDVERLMDGQKADITFTSPPYNAAKNSNLKDKNKYQNNLDEMTFKDYLEFLVNFTESAANISEYQFINIQSLSGNKSSLIDYLHKFKESFADFIVWDKGPGQPAMASNVLNSCFEFVLVFSDKGNRVLGSKEFRGTLDNIVRMSSKSDKDFAKIHKATMPVSFAQHFVESFSNKSVYEPFCGSGSTLIACEKTKRKCFGMEISPQYTQVIIDRWEKFTGNKATKLNGIEKSVD